MDLKCVIATENIDCIGVGPACGNCAFIDNM